MSKFFQKKCFPVFFIILVFILIGGCNNSSENGNNEGDINLNNNAICAYSASIASIKLPLNYTCDDTMAIQRINLPDSLSKFKKYGELIGKVNETNRYIAILYSISGDIQLPTLYTFSKTGEEISSLKMLIGDCCGENEDCSGLSTVQITKDLHIILKDSMQTFERDMKQSDKKRNIKILKKQEEFKIDSSGKILLVSPIS